MSRKRMGALFALATAGTLGLAACGSDSDESSDGSAIGVECVDGVIQAAGSSAQDNAMQEWIATYQEACTGSTIQYQPVGSGAGIQQFLESTVLFAGSDSPMDDTEAVSAAERCDGNDAWHLPMVIGPVALAYNLQGVDSLNLSSETLAGIFANEITTWNDPAIAADNEGVDLPDTPIQAFHRSDESGTTDNFVKYLEGSAGDAWTYGTGKAWKAPGGQGAKGSAGVAAAVGQTNGSIGYMEWSFATNNALSVAMLNGQELTNESVGTAVEAAQVVGEGNDLVVELDYSLDEGYPAVLVTYEIVCSAGGGEGSDLMQSFLEFAASEDGQNLIADLDYSPLPGELADSVRTAVSELTTS